MGVAVSNAIWFIDSLDKGLCRELANADAYRTVTTSYAAARTRLTALSKKTLSARYLKKAPSIPLVW